MSADNPADDIDAPTLEELPDDVAAEIGRGILERATVLYDELEGDDTDRLAEELKEIGHAVLADRHPDADTRAFHAAYVDAVDAVDDGTEDDRDE